MVSISSLRNSVPPRFKRYNIIALYGCSNLKERLEYKLERIFQLGERINGETVEMFLNARLQSASPNSVRRADNPRSALGSAPRKLRARKTAISGRKKRRFSTNKKFHHLEINL